ncbi:Adenylate cyclase [hydrothermal vent metagenome]|uniref:Adenylate cyclase n=1 Tax=hydrothermal vent metagenome TaxID=652676 RepID=A0A3B0SII0_9ZZZZ
MGETRLFCRERKGYSAFMADIFISHARTDRDTVQKLASALEADNFSIWWDQNLESGAEFSADIERELNAAKAVIVCWSKDSIKSQWVKDEATIAVSTDKLKTISLDGTKPPIGYMQYHSLDMSGWKGGRDETVYTELRHAVSTHLDVAGAKQATPAHQTSSRSSSVNFADPKIWGAALAGIVMLLAAVLFGGNFFRGDGGDKITADATVSRDNTIAVLAFTDMSPAGDQEYFSDGISEELLNVLARTQGLEVAGRTSSFSFKGENRDLREIGEILNVSHILEGSVRKAGDKVRITAQLINASNGFHLWSGTYDRELTDIFAVQDEIARAILTEMSPFLPMGADAATNLKPVARTEISAYELYLLARERMTQDGDKAAYEQARSLLDDAIAIDPDYALALAWRAYAESMLSEAMYGVGDTPAAISMPIIKSFADRAIAADSNSAEALFALSMYFAMIHLTGNYEYLDKAIDAQEKALAIRPNFPQLQNDLGFGYRLRGETKKALAMFESAIAHDPGLHDVNTQIVAIYKLLGRFDAAQSSLDRWKRIRPDLYVSDAMRLFLLYGQGQLAEAWRESERLLEQTDSVPRRIELYRATTRFYLHDSDWLTNNSGGGFKAFGALLDGDLASAAKMVSDATSARRDPMTAFRFYIPIMYAVRDYEAIITYYENYLKTPEALITSTAACDCMLAYLIAALKTTGHADYADAMKAWALTAERDRELFRQSPSFFAKEAGRAALNEDFDLAKKHYTRAMDLGWRDPLFIHQDYWIELPDDPAFDALYARMTTLINVERAALSMAPL